MELVAIPSSFGLFLLLGRGFAAFEKRHGSKYWARPWFLICPSSVPSGHSTAFSPFSSSLFHLADSRMTRLAWDLCVGLDLVIAFHFLIVVDYYVFPVRFAVGYNAGCRSWWASILCCCWLLFIWCYWFWSEYRQFQIWVIFLKSGIGSQKFLKSGIGSILLKSGMAPKFQIWVILLISGVGFNMLMRWLCHATAVSPDGVANSLQSLWWGCGSVGVVVSVYRSAMVALFRLFFRCVAHSCYCGRDRSLRKNLKFLNLI